MFASEKNLKQLTTAKAGKGPTFDLFLSLAPTHLSPNTQ